MEGVKKGSSCSASIEGTATMDVDGVAFLTKQLEDEGAIEINM